MASPELVAHIKVSEGLRLEVYLDSEGHPTIGWGHLCHADHPAITLEKAESLLAQDIANAEAGARKLCPELTGARFEALVDLVFNLGAEKLKGAGVIIAFNAGDWHDAATRFRAWKNGRDKAGNLVPRPGLVRRRNALAPWIETNTYTTPEG